MAFTKKPSRKTIKLINLDSSEIDYKNTDLLRNFVDSTGKILSFKQAGVKAKLARKIKNAIKRSRALGLMKVSILRNKDQVELTNKEDI